MSHTPLSHSHRRRIARIYLACVFLLLACAAALLLRFAIRSQDAWRDIIGVLFGYTVAMTLLIGGAWRRTGWCRYVLIGLNWLMLVAFTLIAAFLGSEPRFGWHHTLATFVPPLALFIAANVWLIKSKRIRHLVTPPGSGG
jgi:hypothetical protein